MAKELKVTPAYDIALFDSATGRSLKTTKVVDVSDDCPEREDPDRPVIFAFTCAQRGRIVQMTRPYPKRKYMGVHIHFFVDELDHERRGAPHDDTFGSWARRLGLDKQRLRSLIVSHAPA